MHSGVSVLVKCGADLDVDLSGFKKAMQAKSELAKTVWTYFSRRSLFGRTFDGKMGMISFLSHVASQEALMPIFAQTVSVLGQGVEKALLADKGGADSLEGTNDMLTLECPNFFQNHARSDIKAKLAAYVNACVEVGARFKFFSYAQDKASPKKMPVANGAISYPDNTLVLCCPNVPTPSQNMHAYALLSGHLFVAQASHRLCSSRTASLVLPDPTSNVSHFPHSQR